jgi:biotin transporter BioY
MLTSQWLDVMQNRSGEVIGGNYLIRFVFAAAGTAVALPAIEKIGIGWFSTISAAFLVFSAGLVWLTILYGKEMADWVDQRSAGGNSSDDSSG